MKQVVISIFVFLLCAFMGAHAQIGLSPLINHVSSEQGSAQTVFTAYNLNAEGSVRMQIEIMPFEFTDAGFQLVAAEQQAVPRDLTPYVQIVPREFDLDAGTTQRIRVVARMPPSIATGEYRAALVMSPVATPEDMEREGGEVGTQVRIEIRNAVALYVQHDAKEVNLDVRSARLEEGRLQLAMANAGNTSVSARTQWVLERNGSIVQEGNSRGTLHPEVQRYMTLANEVDLASGTYLLRGVINSVQDSETLASQDFELSFTVP